MITRGTIIALLVLGIGGTAKATTLDTPVLGTVNANDHVVCNILNIGKKSIQALIDLRDPVGGASISQSIVNVEPGTRQRVILSVSQAGGPTNFYCHFDFKAGKNKVRANLSIGDNLTDLTTAEAR